MRARLLGSLVLMFALAASALAQDRRGGSSLDRVLPHVRQTVPGRFYDAEGPFFGPNGHPTYRLKWMTPDGRIIWFGVDAETGQVLGAMPSGPPPGRYRDEDDRGGWNNGPRTPWPNNDGGGWGNGGGGWGNGGGRGSQDSGWGGRGNGNGNGNGGGAPGNHGGQNGGWGGRGGNGGGNGSGPGGQGGGSGRGRGHGGNDRGGTAGHHRPSGG